MNNISFSPTGWDEYLHWQMRYTPELIFKLDTNIEYAAHINQLLKDIRRSPFDGIGKPEPLRYCEGYWSRRIDEKNRLVYAVSGEGDIIVLSCRGHYEK